MPSRRLRGLKPDITTNRSDRRVLVPSSDELAAHPPSTHAQPPPDLALRYTETPSPTTAAYVSLALVALCSRIYCGPERQPLLLQKQNHDSS